MPDVTNEPTPILLTTNQHGTKNISATSPTCKPRGRFRHRKHRDRGDEGREGSQKFNANKDGKISLSELPEVVRTLFDSHAASDLENKQMIAEVDINSDRLVDLKEFTAFHSTNGVTAAGTEEVLKEASWIYDLNDAGLIYSRLLTSTSDHLQDCHNCHEPHGITK